MEKQFDKQTMQYATSQALFHKYELLRSSVSDNTLIYCCEGRDARYYQSRIENITQKRASPLHCGNKKGVLTIYNVLKTRAKNGVLTAAFFIDRDFDTLQNKPDLYETPCYAIENLYCHKDCLRNFLISELGFTEIDTDFTKIMQHFETHLQAFCESITLINAWYLTTKTMRSESDAPLDIPKIDAIFKVKDFVKISFNEIECKYNLETIAQKMTNTTFKIQETKLQHHIRAFQNSPANACVFRGKFQMDFFMQYIVNMLQYAKKELNLDKKMSTNLSINANDRENGLSAFANFAHTPPCLYQYLQDFS